jgi:putative serine protease PepD
MRSPFSISLDSLAWRIASNSDDPGSDPVKEAVQKALQSSCTVYVHSAEGNWTGSGFHVGGGRVVTDSHVCPPILNEVPSEIRISFDGRSLHDARLSASNPDIDAAVLTCRDSLNHVPSMTFGDSDSVQVGDLIAVVSAPEGWSDTAAFGRVSNIHQDVDDEDHPAWNDVIFIDADVLEGSSGGVVVNQSGEAIGVILGVVGTHAKMGIGQSSVCPINKVKNLLEERLEEPGAPFAELGRVPRL